MSTRTRPQAVERINILILPGVSLTFITPFVYWNSYRFNLEGYYLEFAKRTLAIDFLSLAVVAARLFLIQQCP